MRNFSTRKTLVGTDGAGSWLATWASTDSLGGTIGTDSDINQVNVQNRVAQAMPLIDQTVERPELN